MIKELDEAEFKEYIATGVTMVDFWAAWCGPCRVQLPIVEQVAAMVAVEMPDVKVAKVNVDENMGVAAQFKLSSIPCIMFFKDGRLVFSLMGLQSLPTLLDTLREVKNVSV